MPLDNLPSTLSGFTGTNASNLNLNTTELKFPTTFSQNYSPTDRQKRRALRWIDRDNRRQLNALGYEATKNERNAQLGAAMNATVGAFVGGNSANELYKLQQLAQYNLIMSNASGSMASLLMGGGLQSGEASLMSKYSQNRPSGLSMSFLKNGGRLKRIFI